MKIKLIISALFICSLGTAQAGESWGPAVYVSPNNVNNPDPGCNGKTITTDLAKDILTAAGAAYGIPLPPSISIMPISSQNFATCAAVCATIPIGTAVSDNNVDIFWDPDGDYPLLTYGKNAYDRTDAGPGFHRVYSGVTEQNWGAADMACKTVQNWASTVRSFRLHVTY